LVSALAVGTTATSCFVATRIVLTPAPSPVSNIQSRTIETVDSVARLHGLKATTPWPYCTVGGVRGIPEAAWRSGSLSITACVERSASSRIEIEVRRDGWGWNAKGNSINEELPEALAAVLGAVVVTVYRD
jgi:hypothetical protein